MHRTLVPGVRYFSDAQCFWEVYLKKSYEEHFPKVVKYVLTTQKELLQKSTSVYMPFTTNIGKGKVDYYPACVSFQLLIHYFSTLGKEIFQV